MEITMKHRLPYTLTLLLAFNSFNVHANSEDPCVADFISSFEAGNVPLVGAYYTLNNCVLGQKDKTDVAELANKIERITKEETKDETKRDKVRDQISQFMQKARKHQNESLDAVSDHTELSERQTKLTSLMSEVSLQIAKMDNTGTSITSVIQPDTAADDWYSLGTSLERFRVSYKDVIVGSGTDAGACSDIKSDQCLLTLESMTDWLRYQQAASQKVHPFYSNSRLYDFQDYTVIREKKWFNFFEVTNYPLIWEFWVNQQYDRFTYNIGDYGLAEPPDEQLTIFRPSIAAGFSNGLGQSPTAELVVEVVGYTTWEWKEAEAINRWGLSLVGTLGEYKENNDTKTNPGIGFLVHTPTPGISFGLVARKYGKNGLIVTFDLINLWDERKKKVESALNKIDQTQ